MFVDREQRARNSIYQTGASRPMMWNQRRARQSWHPPGVSNLPHLYAGRDTCFSRRFTKISIEGLHDGRATCREMRRVGKIGPLPILVQRMADRFGILDHGVVRVQERGEEHEEFGAGFPITGA